MLRYVALPWRRVRRSFSTGLGRSFRNSGNSGDDSAGLALDRFGVGNGTRSMLSAIVPQGCSQMTPGRFYIPSRGSGVGGWWITFWRKKVTDLQAIVVDLRLTQVFT